MSEGSVVRSYECLREAGGCGQVFQDQKPYHAMHAVMCPNCSMDGSEKYVDEHGRLAYRIAWIPPKIQQIHDVDHADGNTGNRIPMPALGEGVTVGSRSEMNDALKRAREQMYEATNGPHASMVAVKDERTGQVVFEKVTRDLKGFDPGELHVLDAPETAKPQRSPFNPSLSADEHIRRLDEQLGEKAEHPIKPSNPTQDSVPKKRGRPRKI
jgi:hypothetical protein